MQQNVPCSLSTLSDVHTSNTVHVASQVADCPTCLTLHNNPISELSLKHYSTKLTWVLEALVQSPPVDSVPRVYLQLTSEPPAAKLPEQRRL